MTHPPPPQRPDKGLSWWSFFRFTSAHKRAVIALRQLNKAAKLAGALGCEIQSGIAEHALHHEYECDREQWSLRKAYGMYERRGRPVPRECIEAELRHAERMEKVGDA